MIGLFFSALGLSFAVWGDEQSVDGFQEGPVGGFPESWRTVPFKRKRAKQIYRLEQEGGSTFLRAVYDQEQSAIIYRGIKWNLQKFPYLKFRWRAQQLPPPAPDEKFPNDHACGVYVGFGLTSGMKYVWSSRLPEGSYWEKDPGKFYVISREMGTAHAGQWRSITVDVRADYEKYFRKPLSKNPSGIAILTDGDNAQQKAACDYGDFRISDTP